MYLYFWKVLPWNWNKNQQNSILPFGWKSSFCGKLFYIFLYPIKSIDQSFFSFLFHFLSLLFLSIFCIPQFPSYKWRSRNQKLHSNKIILLSFLGTYNWENRWCSNFYFFILVKFSLYTWNWQAICLWTYT